MTDQHFKPIPKKGLGALLDSRNMTQADLAKTLKVHRSTVSRWVSSTQFIPQDQIPRIEKALNLSSEESASLCPPSDQEITLSKNVRQWVNSLDRNTHNQL